MDTYAIEWHSLDGDSGTYHVQASSAELAEDCFSEMFDENNMALVGVVKLSQQKVQKLSPKLHIHKYR